MSYKLHAVQLGLLEKGCEAAIHNLAVGKMW